MAYNYSEPYEDPYISWPIRNIILGTFIPIFPLTIGGNCLVICVIFRNRSMRTVTNFFLANLAVADLMVALFCIIPQMMWFVMPTWPLGAVICKLHKYMLGVTTTASIFILMAISGERFVAIIYPLRIRHVLTIKRLSCILCFLWILSFLVSIPFIRYFEETSINGSLHCSLSPKVSVDEVLVHDVLYFILCYVLPLLVMVYFYARIIISLWLRGRAVYYRTSRHGDKSSSGSTAVEMEVRMHTGGSIKTHAHKTADHVKRVRPAQEQHNVKEIRDTIVEAPVEDPQSLKIGPFFVDYPPPSPRRSRDAVTASKSCENMFLLGSCQNSERLNPPLGRTKSQSTGAIDHYYQQLQQIDRDNEGDKRIEASVHKNFTENRIGNGSAVRFGGSLDRSSENCMETGEGHGDDENTRHGVDNMPLRPRPRPVRQRSSGFLPMKNGYEFLSTIDDDDEILTESQHFHSTPNCVPPRDGKAEPNCVPKIVPSSDKAVHNSVVENHRPTVMVEIVPAESQSPNSRASQRAKKISKSTIATRKKVIRMLVVLVVAFATCLFPMQLYAIWTNTGSFPYTSRFGVLYIPFQYLAYFFNSALNPFLYALLSDNFRMRMRETLDFRGSSRRARWMRTQTRLRSLTSEGTDNDWVA
ncbi:uncharacterized protein [Diadema antillarum]|uniref:uncharacterized protein n=1 Tax=Diadema antillarum TaxID=105358 RepID=UPI003A8C49CF